MQTYAYFIFFLMIRRPPRSTLFPTRRSSDLIDGTLWRFRKLTTPSRPRRRTTRAGRPRAVSGPNSTETRRPPPRSEEHTSELQSQSNLVCRLLLEKKNKPIMQLSSQQLYVIH